MGQWGAILTGLKGRYSLQARLLPGQQEVTGIGGNTTPTNFCDQVTQLNALGMVLPSNWYMLQAVIAHEQVHEAHFLPALRDVALQIEASIEVLSVADTGQGQTQAIQDIYALPEFLTAKDNAQQIWLARILILAANDHNGPTDAAEHAVVDPMIASICAYANANNWGACPIC